MRYKIGHGYDVHRLAAGRELILGGVLIEHECGLLGHSDADVLTHAVIDAMLGAAGLGDIGELFPDTDAGYKNISSLILLERAAALVSENYYISNIDCTVIAEQPKLSPYKQAIKNKLGQILRADINIKAKTEEGLGFAGRAIAAHAVCLLAEREPEFKFL